MMGGTGGMKRKQKETAEQYLERIPSFAKKKSGMEDVRAFLELLGSPDRGMKIFHSVLGLKRGRALLRSLYLAPSFGYPGTVSDPGGDGLTGGF